MIWKWNYYFIRILIIYLLQITYLIDWFFDIIWYLIISDLFVLKNKKILNLNSHTRYKILYEHIWTLIFIYDNFKTLKLALIQTNLLFYYYYDDDDNDDDSY